MQSFNNKQEYLNAVALWKSGYKSLSQDIRQLKHEFKAIQRQGGNEIPLRTKLQNLKSSATAMIEQRMKGKIEAQRQYLVRQ